MRRSPSWAERAAIRQTRSGSSKAAMVSSAEYAGFVNSTQNSSTEYMGFVSVQCVDFLSRNEWPSWVKNGRAIGSLAFRRRVAP
eukprot:6180494-Pleurochrysis_carterae.AAC.3